MSSQHGSGVPGAVGARPQGSVTGTQEGVKPPSRVTRAKRVLFGDPRSLTDRSLFHAGMTALTVFLISAAYSRIIEAFPHGGGGYVVASKVLGEKVGLVSGCALLVDYVLTITISIAAAGDAVFSFLPPEWQSWKL